MSHASHILLFMFIAFLFFRSHALEVVYGSSYLDWELLEFQRYILVRVYLGYHSLLIIEDMEIWNPYPNIKYDLE